MIDAGIDLVRLLEPAPPPGFLAKAPEYEEDVVVTTPRLLTIVGDRRASDR